MNEFSTPLSVRAVRQLGRALPKRLKMTRNGKIVIGLTLGVGMAAINSGNNLLYLVFGMLLSLIMVSGVLSEINLYGIRVRRIDEARFFLGQPALIRVEVTNTKQKLRSISVEVNELVSPAWNAEGSSQKRGLILNLKAGETATCYIEITAGRRGVMPSPGLQVSTGFPFGFFSKRSFFVIPATYIVFPKLMGEATPARTRQAGGFEQRAAGIGSGDEFHGLRDMRPGEDIRNIAWKSSAKRDRLVLREYERPATRRVMLMVSNAVADAEEGSELLERAIGESARLAREMMDAGYAVGISTADGGIHPDTGPSHLARIYDRLARLPIRFVKPGTAITLFDKYDRKHVERVAIITESQREHGLTFPCDREILIERTASDEEQAA